MFASFFVIVFFAYGGSLFQLQVVTVGVVGGSDLVKISEQLGSSGLIQPAP